MLDFLSYPMCNFITAYFNQLKDYGGLLNFVHFYRSRYSSISPSYVNKLYEYELYAFFKLEQYQNYIDLYSSLPDLHHGIHLSWYKTSLLRLDQIQSGIYTPRPYSPLYGKSRTKKMDHLRKCFLAYLSLTIKK